MDSREFADAKRRIGEAGQSLRRWVGPSLKSWAGQSLTSWFDITLEEIDWWSTAGARVPRRRARQIRWLASLADRELQLRRLGIRPCPWVEEREAEFAASGTAAGDDAGEQHEAFVTMIDEHAAGCPQCQRVDAFIKAKGLPPPPQIGLGERIFELFVRLLRFLVPAAIGAAISAFVWLLDAVQLSVRTGDRFVGLVAVVAAAAAGGAAGLVFSLARPVLRRLGPAGDYVTGVVVAFAYIMSAVVVVARLAFRETVFENSGDWWWGVFAVLFWVLFWSVLFGVIGAHVWRRLD